MHPPAIALPVARFLPAVWREAVMALELRPNCEYCDKDLPPAATDARIYTF